MPEKERIRRLSEVRVAGRDYAAKVKIEDVLDHDVAITVIDHVVLTKEVDVPGQGKMELETANYYNITVQDGDVLKTFSTGATPITKIISTLDKSELPLIARFSKQGNTYLVE